MRFIPSGQDAKHGEKTMRIESEYEKQGREFCERNGIDFRAVLVGDDCPTFCEDALADKDMDKVNVYPRRTHIHGKHYRVTFSQKGRGHVSFDFWNSYADSEENAYNFGTEKTHCGHGFDCVCATPYNRDGIITGCRENVYWDKYRGGKPDRCSIFHTRSKKARNVPTPYDVLASLTKYEPGSFENFCADYGYDSRRAEQTYHAVVAEWNKVQKFFTPAERAEMEGIQ